MDAAKWKTAQNIEKYFFLIIRAMKIEMIMIATITTTTLAFAC